LDNTRGVFMKIVILSDIHDNLLNLHKVINYVNKLKPSEVIFCGDLVSPFTMASLSKELREESSLIGVFGNNEGDKITIMKRIREGFLLRDQPMLHNIDDIRVLIMHGFGSIKETENTVLSLAKSMEYDIILFGHTHQAKIFTISRETRSVNEINILEEMTRTDILKYSFDLSRDVLIVNPGEVCGWLTNIPLFSEMEFSDKKIQLNYYRIDKL